LRRICTRQPGLVYQAPRPGVPGSRGRCGEGGYRDSSGAIPGSKIRAPGKDWACSGGTGWGFADRLKSIAGIQCPAYLDSLFSIPSQQEPFSGRCFRTPATAACVWLPRQHWTRQSN